MKIFIVAKDEKCGECDKQATLFALGNNSQQEAASAFKELGTGFCAECMIQALINSNAGIRIPK